MTSVIVTTPEEIKKIVTQGVKDAITELASVSQIHHSPEALRLEQLKIKEFLSSDEVEALYGIPRATLATNRSRNMGPSFIRIGRSVAYTHKDILEYIHAGYTSR